MDSLTISKKYCNSLTEYSRFKTREVKIGNVPLGGSNPIRVQSMTTTDTMDTLATVEQSIRIIEAGSDYVRITAPALKEAKNLENIKKSVQGLYEILNINFSDEDIYFKLGQDNLLALYENLLELILNEYGLRKLVKKIKDSEFDLDICLDNLYIEK